MLEKGQMCAYIMAPNIVETSKESLALHFFLDKEEYVVELR